MPVRRTARAVRLHSAIDYHWYDAPAPTVVPAAL
jgi:hypothetical protein